MTQPNNFTPQIKLAKNFPEAKWEGKKTWKKTELTGLPTYTDDDLKDLAEFLAVMIFSAVEDLQAEKSTSGDQGKEDKRDYKSEISSRAASLRRNQKQGGLDA